jgi:hypothetical protein
MSEEIDTIPDFYEIVEDEENTDKKLNINEIIDSINNSNKMKESNNLFSSNEKNISDTQINQVIDSVTNMSKNNIDENDNDLSSLSKEDRRKILMQRSRNIRKDKRSLKPTGRVQKIDPSEFKDSPDKIGYLKKIMNQPNIDKKKLTNSMQKMLSDPELCKSYMDMYGFDKKDMMEIAKQFLPK